MDVQPKYSDVPAVRQGQQVFGAHQNGIRFGLVEEANGQLYFVRWMDGSRSTCMQGFDYGDALQVLRRTDAG